MLPRLRGKKGNHNTLLWSAFYQKADLVWQTNERTGALAGIFPISRFCPLMNSAALAWCSFPSATGADGGRGIYYQNRLSKQTNRCCKYETTCRWNIAAIVTSSCDFMFCFCRWKEAPGQSPAWKDKPRPLVVQRLLGPSTPWRSRHGMSSWRALVGCPGKTYVYGNRCSRKREPIRQNRDGRLGFPRASWRKPLRLFSKTIREGGTGAGCRDVQFYGPLFPGWEHKLETKTRGKSRVEPNRIVFNGYL